jgi:hypothetical protein
LAEQGQETGVRYIGSFRAGNGDRGLCAKTADGKRHNDAVVAVPVYKAA